LPGGFELPPSADTADASVTGSLTIASGADMSDDPAVLPEPAPPVAPATWLPATPLPAVPLSPPLWPAGFVAFSPSEHPIGAETASARPRRIRAGTMSTA